MTGDLAVVGRWSARVWRENPGLALWIALGSIPVAALLVAFPWLWQLAVDAVRDPTPAVTPGELAAWMLAVGLGHVAVHVGVQSARAYGNAVVSEHARRAALRAVIEADPDALRGWRAGELVSRLHDDAGEKIAWFLCSGVFRAWEAALIAIACLVTMAAAEPRLAIWVVVPLPVLLALQVVGQARMSALQERTQRAIAGLSEEIAGAFGALRVVQVSGLGPAVEARFRRAAEEQRDAEIRGAAAETSVALLYQYGWQVALGGLLLFGGLEVIEGRVGLGRYVAFEGLLATMVWPMFDLGVLLSKLPQTAVALRRLDEVNAIPAAPTPSEEVVGDGLRAVGLTVRDGERVLLDGVDLEVAPGARVAVVGAVGAGKTVLLDALSGLREHEGRLEWGGVPLAALPPGAGGRVAPVPQDPVLLTGTVRENVLLGRTIDEREVRRALAASRLVQDLERLSGGMDAAVGERGVTLSGGQRQRVAIARALVGRPALLLLDDATSALDGEVEAEFWSALDREYPGMATLVVTHRTGTLARADEVVVLASGRVVARGTHADLLATSAVYRALYGESSAASRIALPSEPPVA